MELQTTDATPPAQGTLVWRAAGAAPLLLVGLLIAMSAYNFSLRCESFGCMGIGLVWTIWLFLWLAALGVALGVRALLRRRGLSTRTCGLALWLLGALGAGHGLYWLVHVAL